RNTFGDYNPGGKLPITFPRNVGQLPLFYSYKPSGRGYGYVENDGSPMYPFGYGLSYTTFATDNISFNVVKDSIEISLSIKNTGDMLGSEVIQIYFTGTNGDVVLPCLELKAYKRVYLNAGEEANVTINVPNEAFSYLDKEMNMGMHDADYVVSVATSSVDVLEKFELKVRNKEIIKG
ncbi:MAG: beta-glucosidase, partial [Clostridiales bacterium]|nr:beta-glucosidase [Clostridiales bacterium]